MAGMTLGEAMVFIRGDDRPLWGTINGIANRLARGIPGLIGGGLTIAVKGASGLNETMNKLNVIFGDSATVATQTADTMADKFGIVKNSILDVQGTFGMLLQSMGKMSEDASAELSSTLAQAAADASSLYNTSFEDAAFKISSALRGMSRPIAAYGIDTQLAAVKQEAFRMGLISTKRDLTTAEKVAARVSLVMKGLAVAQGDLGYTQHTFANATRQAWGRVSNTLTTVGQSLLPPIERFLGGLNSVLVGVNKWVDGNKGLFEEFAANVESTFLDAKGMFLDIADAVGATGQRLFAEVATWTGFNEAVASGWDWLRDQAKAVFDGIGVVFRNWSLIGEYTGVLVMEKLTNVGEVMDWLMGVAGQFGGWFGKNWVNMIRDGAVGAWTVLSNLATNIKNLFAAVWDFLSKGGKGGFNFQFTPFLEGFQAATEKLPEIAKPAFSNMQDQLNEIAGKMVDVELKRVDDMAAAMGNALGKAAGLASAPERPRPNKPLMGEEDADIPGKAKKEKKASHDDFSSFAKSLQEGVFGKDDSAKRTAKATEQTAKDMGKLVGAVIGKKGAATAVAAGPD